MDQSLIESTWTEHADGIHRFIASKVDTAEDADDLTQDVFVKFSSAIETIRNDYARGWLFRVARNVVADYYRQRQRERRTGLSEVFAAAHPTGPLVVDHAANASVRPFAPGAIGDCIDAIMVRLSPADREAIELTELKGITQAEMARQLGISLSGAKSRVQRARQRIQKIITDCCHLERDARGNVMDYYCHNDAKRICPR